jgi:hypothetical protein
MLRVFMKFIPLRICHPHWLTSVPTIKAGSQTQGKIGTRLMPWKRLIWAAVGSDYYIVHYERGGIAHTFHVLVTKLAKNDAKPKIIWSAVGGPLKNYAAFLDALRNGKLDDRLNYPR